MAEKLLPEALIRIRDKYPASKCLKDHWGQVKKLVKDGKEKEAEDLAKKCLINNPHLQVRNKVAIHQRRERVTYLKVQRDLEAQIRDALGVFVNQVTQMLTNNADKDGKIPLAKMKGMIDRAKDYHTQAWSNVLTLMKGGVRDAVQHGIVGTMNAAQKGLDHHRQMHESSWTIIPDLIQYGVTEADLKATIAKTSATFKTIFNRVQKRNIKQKLFTGQSGVNRTGVSLSRRVWDVRDWNVRRMRNTITNGIVDGTSAGSMASKIKGMTVTGNLNDDSTALEPGQGVYKSAYKNALRVTRTETNNAYVDAQTEYAAQKSYQMMWNVNQGHRTEDECDDLAGEVFDPEDIDSVYPQHPQDACFFTTVIPDLG